MILLLGVCSRHELTTCAKSEEEANVNRSVYSQLLPIVDVLMLSMKGSLSAKVSDVFERSFAVIEIRPVVVGGVIKLLHPAGFHS